MRLKRSPAGFIVPAQPVIALRPPSGAAWVHEIKHDGYRMMVRRDGPTVRIYSRNAYNWTARLSAIATAAERIKAKSFTIDGEAVVLGPEGLSRFDELRRREAARTAILYAFDLIEHDGEDLRDRPFLDRKAALGATEGAWLRKAPRVTVRQRRTPAVKRQDHAVRLSTNERNFRTTHCGPPREDARRTHN